MSLVFLNTTKAKANGFSFFKTKTKPKTNGFCFLKPELNQKQTALVFEILNQTKRQLV